MITMQNVVRPTTSHTVCAQVKGIKTFLARWYTVPLGWGMSDPLETRPHGSYNVIFGRYRSNCVGVNRGPRNWGEALDSCSVSMGASDS